MLYALAFALCFPAIVAHPGTRIPNGGDELGALRNIWVTAVEHRNPFTLTHDYYDEAPNGQTVTPAVTLAQSTIQTGFLWGLRGPLGLVGAANLLLFLGLLGTGLALFWLLIRLGCSYPASLLGGYLFAFGPYDLERAYAGHMALLQNWIFVLLAAALLRLDSRRSPRAAALVGVVLALAFYLSAYQGLLASFMTLVFLAVDLARQRTLRSASRTILEGLLAYATVGVLLSPLLILSLAEQTGVHTATAGYTGDHYTYSASVLAYLIPSPRNPLFHWLSHVHPADLTEQTLYVGYTACALAIIGVALFVRRDSWLVQSRARSTAVLSCALLVPAAALMSLPPSYQLGSLRVPMPSATIGLVSSIWRAYARFGLLSDFAVIVLAALSLSALARRPGKGWRFLMPIAAALMFLEVLPGHAPTVSTVPSVQPSWVQWLATQPRGIIATYPWTFSATLDFDDWYETYDRDPQFDLPAEMEVVPPNVDQEIGVRLLADDLGSPVTASLLATEHVRYVIVHMDAYRAAGKAIPRLEPPAYHLLRRFGGVDIYTVHAPMVDLTTTVQEHEEALAQLEGLAVPPLSYGDGFHAPEHFQFTISRWMNQNGQLIFANGSYPAGIIITGLAFSNKQSRLVEVIGQSGAILAREVIPAYKIHIKFGPFVIPAGTTAVTLVAYPGPTRLGATDPRIASVFFQPLTVATVPQYLANPGTS